MSGQGSLSGIRILDFSRVLAGPLCTMMLGDLGADVIKIESPQGDDTRTWGPPWVGDTADKMSAYFLSVNRNKRSLVLDLKTDKGVELARQLSAEADVIVENFRVGQMARFGLGYERLQANNPRLVYVSVTGFGQSGPYRDRPGYDYVIQAMSGLMSITGETDGPPMKIGVALSDVIAGLNACIAILAALRHAESTGQGQYIDIALLDTQLAALVNVASNALVSGMDSQRYGNQHPNIVPYQTFAASDGEFVVAIGNDRQFSALCEIIGQPKWRNDPKFATNPVRVANRELLVAALQAIFRIKPQQYWVDALLSAGIPAGPIQTVQQALSSQHVHDRDLRWKLNVAEGLEIELLGSPLKLSEIPPVVRYPPPKLGEHSTVILREWLGASDSELEDYRRSGALGKH